MGKLDEKHVIAIWGSPESGKSTVAANMATILADSGYMTCLLSASDFGRLQVFFGTAIPRGKGIISAVTSGRNVRESLIEVRPNLCLLEMDTGGDSVEAIITEEHVDTILRELRDQFTYVIVDCTSYKESIFTGYGLRDADKIICCVPHSVAGATWHISNRQFFTVLGPKTVYIDTDFKLGGTNFETVLESIEVPKCMLRIGAVKSAYYCENNGLLIVHQGGREEKKFKQAIMQLIKIVLSMEDEDKYTAQKNKKKKEKEDKRAEKLRAREEAAARKQEKKQSFGRKKPDAGYDPRAEYGEENEGYDAEPSRKPARGAYDPPDYEPRSEYEERLEENESYDEFEEEEEDLEAKPHRFRPEREVNDIEGRQRVMSSRDIRKAEERAIARAAREQSRGYDSRNYRPSDYNENDDDDD